MLREFIEKYEIFLKSIEEREFWENEESIRRKYTHDEIEAIRKNKEKVITAVKQIIEKHKPSAIFLPSAFSPFKIYIRVHTGAFGQSGTRITVDIRDGSANGWWFREQRDLYGDYTKRVEFSPLR